MQKFCLVDQNLRIKYMTNQSKKSVKENRWGVSHAVPVSMAFCWEIQRASRMQISPVKSQEFETLTLKTHEGKIKKTDQANKIFY